MLQRTLGLLTGAGVLMAAFVAIERRVAEPMLPLGLFRRGAFTGVQLAAVAVSASLFALFLYLTLYLQNYLGYSYRNLGQLDLAFGYYGRALELNPRHRGAHEYAGEAYLMVGDLAHAEEHLAALRKICLLPCEELGDLEREIAAYRKRTGAGRAP